MASPFTRMVGLARYGALAWRWRLRRGVGLRAIAWMSAFTDPAARLGSLAFATAGCRRTRQLRPAEVAAGDDEERPAQADAEGMDAERDRDRQHRHGEQREHARDRESGGANGELLRAATNSVLMSSISWCTSSARSRLSVATSSPSDRCSSGCRRVAVAVWSAHRVSVGGARPASVPFDPRMPAKARLTLDGMEYP